MQKRLLALISAGVMMFGLTACTGTAPTNGNPSESASASEMSSEKVEAVPYSEAASELIKDANEKASELKSDANDKASELKSEANEKASELKSEASEKVKQAKDKASELKSEASESK